MTLEERYNQAAETTYVGKVRAQQAADAGARGGVNFMDGDGRGSWSQGQTPAVDQVQTEFSRNAAGAYRYGGAGKVPASTNDKTYPLSRWLSRGVTKGDTYFTNTRFINIGDVRNAPGTRVHKYSPLTEDDKFIAKALQELAKGRVNGSASGPAPAGLNG
jgi:hypothetical protein